MQKELNPDLFGESGLSRSRHLETASPSVLGTQQLKELDLKLAEMRMQVNATIENMNRFATQVNEALRQSHQKFEKMEQVVGQLEQGQHALTLEIALYERGAALKAHCAARLKEAEEKVEKIRLAEGRAVGTDPVEGM